jgi:hypothetical protein
MYTYYDVPPPSRHASIQVSTAVDLESDNAHTTTLPHNPANSRCCISSIRITRLKTPHLRDLRGTIREHVPSLTRIPFFLRIKISHNRPIHICKAILLHEYLRPHAAIDS